MTFLAELAKLGLEPVACNFAKFQLAPRAGPGKRENMLGIPKMCPVWGLCLPFPRPSGSHRQGLGPPTICGQRKKNCSSPTSRINATDVLEMQALTPPTPPPISVHPGDVLCSPKPVPHSLPQGTCSKAEVWILHPDNASQE